VHTAARFNNPAALRLLLEAEPRAALAEDWRGRTALEAALIPWGDTPLEGGPAAEAAHWLLSEGPLLLPSANRILPLLHLIHSQPCAFIHAHASPLYHAFVARQALTPAEWAQVPSPLPGLSTSLPAVLARSTGEAALLVQRLPPADSERLRMGALCLARAQKQEAALLPIPIVWRVLALAVA